MKNQSIRISQLFALLIIFFKMEILLCLCLLSSVVIAEYQGIQVVEGLDFNLMCKLSSINGKSSCGILDKTYKNRCFYEASYQQREEINCSATLSGRVEFTGNIQKGVCSFKVLNSKRTDEGYWGCKAMENGYNQYDIPEWTYVKVDTTVDRTYSITEGSQMTLECESNFNVNYCHFSHKNENCCRSKNGQKNCDCTNPNLSIHFIQKICQMRIKKVEMKDAGYWTCKSYSYYPGRKIYLEVTPKNKSPVSDNHTISSDESNKFQESTIILIIVGSVACVIVCGLISVGILHYYSKKYPSLDSTEND